MIAPNPIMAFAPGFPSSRSLAPAASDPAATPGALSALRQVLEATLSHDIEAFEPFALRRLGQLVGFDGGVWGSGVVAAQPLGAFSITHASVVDRPATLLAEYAGLAGRDPVTARWLAQPDRALAVDVDHTYRSRSNAVVGDYLRRHRIAHLLLLGGDSDGEGTQARSRHWITAYRESPHPFGDADVGRLHALLPLWDQARELCLARHMERLARAHPLERSVIALSDRAGLIHVAEPEFSALTALRRGDSLPAKALLRSGPDAGGCESAIAVDGIWWRVSDAGSWWLVQASRAGAAAGLSQRERQVARRYADGLSYKEIARELGSSPSTVRTQLQNVYRRLEVHSRTELQRALAAPGSA